MRQSLLAAILGVVVGVTFITNATAARAADPVAAEAPPPKMRVTALFVPAPLGLLRSGAPGDVATVGITQHATEQLGDIVFVQLPDIGAKLAKGDGAAIRWFEACFSDFKVEKTLVFSVSLSLVEACSRDPICCLSGCDVLSLADCDAGSFFCAAFLSCLS